MTWKECLELIDADYARLNKRRFGKFGYLITNHSFKITFWFRIGSYLRSKSGFYKLLLAIVWPIYKHYEYKTGIQLPLGVSVGGGLKFPHFGTIIISYLATIGKNCTIYQGCTIGQKDGRTPPRIGNNVTLYSGAIVIGSTIGDDAVVGAGSVVCKDVEAGSVVAGVPAKVVLHN